MTNFTSVFLSVGTTIAILALFGEVEVLILLLMAIDSDSAKTADANLRGLVSIFSIPGPFMELKDFGKVLVSLEIILEPQLEEGIEIELDCKFLFLWISTILG